MFQHLQKKIKLDGVSLLKTDQPPTSSNIKKYLYIFLQLQKVAPDTWHMTRDRQGVVIIVSKLQVLREGVKKKHH